MQLDTPYFLAPSSPAANKPYVLMREALARSGKAAVGKFAMRNSEHLALIRAARGRPRSCRRCAGRTS